MPLSLFIHVIQTMKLKTGAVLFKNQNIFNVLIAFICNNQLFIHEF